MLLTAFALHAAVAQQQCRTLDARLPVALRGWKVSGSGLDTGHTVTLNAGRDKALRTSVTIRRAGTYGIALDQAGWIDVAPARGKPLESVAHGHGPECSTIRKIVRYKLRPGTYRVDVTRLKAARARLMLVRY
ncbi:hypothetical protein RZN05_20280 [Sphingomonas sp. HF-S4]|uniref:Homogentisate 1,2-dioxygenase n=1 Tax=Sphingomonas agrestis TaxID=3080540 RepID=A0ABU3YD66_9SPHN|nr:hypothetical protein [Sphingomonas sp. HF-S4]MDV3459343.1 hypothetical protein [Sphingomonas sp. HF-S4]